LDTAAAPELVLLLPLELLLVLLDTVPELEPDTPELFEGAAAEPDPPPQAANANDAPRAIQICLIRTMRTFCVAAG
jgi:hypothetical protein